MSSGGMALASISLACLSALHSTAVAADLTFWHAMSGKAGEAVAAQCQRFNAAQREHHVDCSFQGTYERLMQKTVAAFRAGRQPGLVQFHDIATQDLALSGAVLPVAELYRQAAPAPDWSDYLAPVRAAYADRKGELIGQPYNASTALLYTNDSMLRAAGVAVPPATWEALHDDARRLQSAGVRCPFVTDLQPWRVLEQFSAIHGLPIAGRHNGLDGFGASYNVDGALQVRHLQDLIDGRREGWLKLAGDTRAGEMSSAFRSGECAMQIDSNGSWGGIRSTLGLRDGVTVGSMPVYAGHTRHASLAGGAALYVMQGLGVPQQAAARAFLSFVRRPEEQLTLVRQTGFLPVTQSAVRALRESGADASPEFAAVKAGLASLAEPPSSTGTSVRLGFYMQFRDVWFEEVQKAFAERQSVATALAQANARGDALLRRFEQLYPQASAP